MTLENIPFEFAVRSRGSGAQGLPQSEWTAYGQYPVIGQGADFIEGWTNRKDLLISPSPSLVLYGGHTRRAKYVDFPFVLGPNVKVLEAIDKAALDHRYLFYFLSGLRVKSRGYADHFPEVKRRSIPLLPLNDQVRTAHLLGKVERLISQRKEHLQQLDDLLKSVFLEMFGDPVRNDKGWDTEPFSQVGKFTSGGTPSKSRDDFWIGEYPWVSPKDMKVPKIFDSEDHISAKVFDETSLKLITPGHLLIVVRGMILAHSFPAAINMVDVAINQDMKAIKLKSNLRTTYVFHCLNALKRQILKLITTAGHGTKKFDSDVMVKLLIPVPPLEIQDNFLLIAHKVEQTKYCYQQSLNDLETLYGSLSQQAFKGKLDLSRMVLTSEITARKLSNE
ncbi:restriction endonuclease subunit S [Methylobacillus flagellatus]|uniref:restriction endonuclease subunit S n=1 Tax=Methylobacillus flagellatus TaxID=405 RepID=UPI0010F8D398|nr:restriction endonuclease subunit S [Methylobacillus flagellatus]